MTRNDETLVYQSQPFLCSMLWVKGEISFHDADPDLAQIRIEVHKAAGSPDVLREIQVQKNLHDVGYGAFIYVLQVDYEEKRTSLLVIVGGLVATVTALVLVCVVIWLYHKRRGGEQPLSSTASSASTHTSSPHRQQHHITATQSPGISPRRVREERKDNTLTRSYDCTDDSLSRTRQDKLATTPIPPPPRLYNGGPKKASDPPSLARSTSNHSSVAGGAGSPRGPYKSTLVTFTIIGMVSCVYAAVCSSQPEVRILIFVPTFIRPGIVRVFYNQRHQNYVVSDLWYTKNTTTIQVYDLASAPVTDRLPCNAQQACPRSLSRSLAGCDAAHASCVCERGYSLDRGSCVDIDECHVLPAACPVGARCQNTRGAYICHCGQGYYHYRNTCKVCSKECSKGTYESTPCTYTSDRVCSACQRCTGSSYEARPCTANSDQHCIHAAHPVLIGGEETVATYVEVLERRNLDYKRQRRLKAEASSNVFMENLHNTRDLTTTYYVTDNKQATDFFWYRESTIRVNIGITHVNIIPEYVDVEYESDNNFMLGNPNTIEEKAKFTKATRQYCRNPIPDYYSLTLEVSRDRTTRAETVICDSNDPSKVPCPKGYKNGDEYLHRTLNEACTKMSRKGTFPEPLQPAANSVVCTKDTALLTDIFNKTAAPVRPIKFPPKKCKNAINRCDQCVNQLHECQHLIGGDPEFRKTVKYKNADLFGQMCCKIDCYTQSECKVSQSEECTDIPVECAQGDAYRYTIQPVYQTIMDSFSCHIRHRKPDIVYKLWFYVSIVGTEWETPKIFRTVTKEDLGNLSQGAFDMEFFTVEHNVGLHLTDDLILIGKDIPGQYNKKNFTIHPMKKPSEYGSQKPVAHEITHQISQAVVQFDEPFGYSTSTWVNGGHQCNKDTSKFRSVQKHYHDSPVQVVNPVIQAVGAPYEYILKSYSNPPYMRFVIPSNISVLHWWFRDNGPRLVTNSSLRGSLRLTDDKKIWSITLTGVLDGCPGYVNIRVNDRTELEELFHYDILVSCPANFSLDFKVPNWGMKFDKTFDIFLSDAKTEFRLFLTHLTLGNLTDDAEPVYKFEQTELSSGFLLFSTVLIVLLISVVTFVIAYMYMENTKMMQLPLHHTKYSAAGATATGKSHRRIGCCHGVRNMTSGQFMFVVIYLVYKVVYSLLFTFTVMSTVLLLYLHSDIAAIKQIPHIQAHQYNKTHNISASIEQHTQSETLRQASVVTNMQGACANYIEQLSKVLHGRIEGMTKVQNIPSLYYNNSSISHNMMDRYSVLMQRYDEALDEFSERLRQDLRTRSEPLLTLYNKHAQDVYTNGWFTFPLSLFNASKMFSVQQKAGLSATEQLEFMWFLEIEGSETSYFWERNFWERYFNTLPEPPTFTLPEFIPGLCSNVDHRNESYPLPHENDLNKMDSTRSFVTSNPDDPELWGWSLEEFKNWETDGADTYWPQKEPLTFNTEEFLSTLHLEVLRLVLLSIDLVLLIYRFSHLYLSTKNLCQGFQETIIISEDDIKKTSAKLLQYADHNNEQLIPLQTTLQNDFQNSTDFFINHSSSLSRKIDGNMFDMVDVKDRANHKQPNGNAVPVQDTLLRTDSNEAVAPITLPILTKPDKSAFSKLKNTASVFTDKLVDTELLPKCIFGVFIIFSAFVILQFAHVVVCLESLDSVGAFGGFVNRLKTHLSSTNQYLEWLGGDYTDILRDAYTKFMETEFLEVQGVVQYFNEEQSRLAANFRQEVCAIKNISGSHCNVSVVPPSVQIPILPCNFVPVQPKLYSDYNSESFTNQLMAMFQPVVTAAHSLITSSCLFVLLLGAVMLILHLAGSLVFTAMRTRLWFPVHYQYIVSSTSGRFPLLPVFTEAPLPGNGASTSETDLPAASSNSTTYKDPSKPSKPRSKFGLHVQFSDSKAHQEKTETLLHDMGYSETKV